MNLEIIKQAISDSMPENVDVSNIDIHRGNGSLTVKLVWALKDDVARIMDGYRGAMNCGYARLDGYRSSMPNFDLDVNVSKMEARVFECKDRSLDNLQQPPPLNALFGHNMKSADWHAKRKETHDAWASAYEPFSSPVIAGLVRDKLSSFIPSEQSEFLKAKAAELKDDSELSVFADLIKNQSKDPDPLIAIESAILFLRAEAKTRFEDAKTEQDLRSVHSDILGKDGGLSDILKMMNKIPPNEFLNIGKKVNKLRADIDSEFEKYLSLFSMYMAPEPDEDKSDELYILPILRDLISHHPVAVQKYHEGKTGNLGFLLTKASFKPGLRGIAVKRVSDLIEKLLKEAQPETKKTQIPSNVNIAYYDRLIRAGIDSVQAERMAEIKLPKTTWEGKVITPIDLKDPPKVTNASPNGSAHVPWPDTKESVKEANAERKKRNEFRRAEGDTIIDGYGVSRERPRFVKKAVEVVDEYMKACELYEKKFGGTPTSGIKGKRGNTWFSTNLKDITDVEIMILGNEKLANVIDPQKPKPVQKPAPKTETVTAAPTPEPTKFNKVMFHLKEIKAAVTFHAKEVRKAVFQKASTPKVTLASD